jgi:site-specific recombinase XerD
MMNLTQNNLRDYLTGFEQHLQELYSLRASSIKNYQARVLEFFNFRAEHAQDGPVHEIKGEDVKTYLEDCGKRGNGNQCRAMKLTVLRRFFQYLVFIKIIVQDPTEDLCRPASQNDLMHSFTRDEVLLLFEKCDISEKGLRDKVFLVMGAFAGLRVGEIVRFNVEQVQDDGKEIDLGVAKDKKGENRIVRLWSAPSTIVRALLAARLAQGARKGDPLLVSYLKSGRPRGNRRLTACSCDRLLKGLAERANIQRAVIKTDMLRVTHILSLHHIRGYDTARITERMGWKIIGSQARYFPLVRREDIHHEYESLDDYWSAFAKST